MDDRAKAYQEIILEDFDQLKRFSQSVDNFIKRDLNDLKNSTTEIANINRNNPKIQAYANALFKPEIEDLTSVYPETLRTAVFVTVASRIEQHLHVLSDNSVKRKKKESFLRAAHRQILDLSAHPFNNEKAYQILDFYSTIRNRLVHHAGKCYSKSSERYDWLESMRHELNDIAVTENNGQRQIHLLSKTVENYINTATEYLVDLTECRFAL